MAGLQGGEVLGLATTMGRQLVLGGGRAGALPPEEAKRGVDRLAVQRVRPPAPVLQVGDDRGALLPREDRQAKPRVVLPPHRAIAARIEEDGFSGPDRERA